MENNQILTIDNINVFNQYHNSKTAHPLVSFVDFSKSKPRQKIWTKWNVYAIFLKDSYCGEIHYGRSKYDYQDGTLLFLSPGQIFKVDNPGEIHQPFGYGLVFHPDLIRGTSLGKSIKNYSFFSYEANEALHFSDDEREELFSCLKKIKSELNKPIDKHSKKIIVSSIELFLDYCSRFYERQFILRENINLGILERLESLIDDYFNSDKPISLGLPNVSYFASLLNLSPNYFGDLVKKETGQKAIDYIHEKMIELAKDKIFNENKNFNQIAFELGFKYQQHFTRLFKQKVGLTPKEYKFNQN